MIISEKQIMQLIAIAHGYIELLENDGSYTDAQQVNWLLAEITKQQSSELKVFE